MGPVTPIAVRLGNGPDLALKSQVEACELVHSAHQKSHFQIAKHVEVRLFSQSKSWFIDYSFKMDLNNQTLQIGFEFHPLSLSSVGVGFYTYWLFGWEAFCDGRLLSFGCETFVSAGFFGCEAV